MTSWTHLLSILGLTSGSLANPPILLLGTFFTTLRFGSSTVIIVSPPVTNRVLLLRYLVVLPFHCPSLEPKDRIHDPLNTTIRILSEKQKQNVPHRCPVYFNKRLTQQTPPWTPYRFTTTDLLYTCVFGPPVVFLDPTSASRLLNESHSRISLPSRPDSFSTPSYCKDPTSLLVLRISLRFFFLFFYCSFGPLSSKYLRLLP